MNISTALIAFLLMVGVLVGCAGPQISRRPVTQAEPAAVALVRQAQRAQGGDAFRKIRRLQVTYDGKWAAIGPRFQPALADTRFRGSSVETLDLATRSMTQEYRGPAGQKSVMRQPGKIRVSYNGTLSRDSEKLSAAALVADAYTMFILGPSYFDRPEVTLVLAGEAPVDDALCDKVLAVLRPGFGVSAEDRVVLFIDRSTKQLRRVRMTLNGLDSTQGAEVDVTFRAFRRISGVLWPTDFDERIRVPFKLHAHHWKLVDLKVNPRPMAGE